MYREYMALFQILDACYQKGANDDLPALLGEMSPYVFADLMPADKMVYDDWAIRCRDLKNALDWKPAIHSLLEEYEKEYHFAIGCIHNQYSNVRTNMFVQRTCLQGKE